MLESYLHWVMAWLGIEAPRQWCVSSVSQVNGSFDAHTPFHEVKGTEDFGTSDSHNNPGNALG